MNGNLPLTRAHRHRRAGQLTGLFVGAILWLSSPFTQAELQTLNEIEARLDPLEAMNTVDGIKRSIDLAIQFESGSARLTHAAREQLDVLGTAMTSTRLSRYRFEVIGHTDSTGSAQTNLALSEKRAGAAVAYLVQQWEVEPARLKAIGKGESRPRPGAAPTDSSQRRVEVVALPLTQADDSLETLKTDETGDVEIVW